MNNLQAVLELAAPRSKGLANCWQRCKVLADSLGALVGETPPAQVHWYETFRKAFVIHFTPLLIAPLFRNYMESRKQAYVFTSATLATGKGFTHFAASLGIDEYTGLQLASPFNYQEQALLYCPRGMPDPKEPHYESINRSCITVD